MQTRSATAQPHPLLPVLEEFSTTSPTTNDEESSSSTSSESSPTPPPLSPVLAPKKQTLQLKDYRPPSTLHLIPRSSHTFTQRIVSIGIMHPEYHDLKPKELDRGEIPVHGTLGEHWWILRGALVAPVLQQLSYWAFPNYKWPIALAYPVYLVCFTGFAISCLKHFDYWAKVYGTYDEKKIGRDRIPDQSIGQLARGFLAFVIFRTLGEFYLKWDKLETPFQAFRWSTPVRYFVWLVVMDYFFYIYHRSCHEIPYLWSIHQKHHQTKHPNPVLSILADGYQEVIEIALVPLAATLIVPMRFHELYLLICYTAYVEIFGHTGIRAKWHLPITGPILSLVGCELIVEDHDLHHRYGKGGKNYGKQTRVWDVLFGTTAERIEMRGLEGLRET
ncbi:hypothetical protein T439DRAFT_319235 [Meredithblackwellia eburnea MCA 4105]